MTATTAPRTCTFDWCRETGPQHGEHTWTDSAPAEVRLKPGGRVYVYAVASDDDRFGDQVLVGIEDIDGDGAPEGWLSVDAAEYLRDALTKAIAYARRTNEVDGRATR